MKHGGGLQAVGNILGVPFDQKKVPWYRKTPKESKIVLFDVSNPASPTVRKVISMNNKAGAVGMTKLANGNYLMVVGGFDGDMSLKFCELDSNLDIVDTVYWNEERDGLMSGTSWSCWPGSGIIGTACGAGYQSLTLVNQCDGKIFMIGMHAETKGGSGYDRADLIELVSINGGRMGMKKVFESNDFLCGQWGGGAQCDFQAAGSAYVDRDGNLILYSAEHDNDGPRVGGRGQKSVKMAEFYHD